MEPIDANDERQFLRYIDAELAGPLPADGYGITDLAMLLRLQPSYLRKVISRYEMPADEDGRYPTDIALIKLREYHQHRLDMVGSAPAGMDAIPSGMPDAPHSDAQLAYDLQTFNALVSANTAMTSELAGLNTIVIDLRDRLKDEKSAREASGIAFSEMSNRYDDVCKAMTEQRKDAEKALTTAREDAIFQRKTISALEQRLQRTFGYVDRVLEQEQSYEKAPAIEARPMVPAKGPAVSDIGMPVRDNTRANAAANWDPISASRAYDFGGGTYDTPRRY
jgi:hypothetical protein